MEAIKIKLYHTDYVTLAKRLLAVNGFSLEHSFNPHKVKAYVLCNQFGAVCVAIGGSLDEALDNAVDNECLNGLMVDDQDDHENEDYTPLGNASELFDLTYLSVVQVVSQYNKKPVVILPPSFDLLHDCKTLADVERMVMSVDIIGLMESFIDNGLSLPNCLMPYKSLLK